MNNYITNAWVNFSTGKINQALNEPATVEEIKEGEKKLKLLFPSSLKTILQINNGQNSSYPGIFKNISGWDIYNKLYFLNIQQIIKAKHLLDTDEHLIAEFRGNYLPFAAQNINELTGDMYAIHVKNHEIFTLWTSYPDWTSAPEWQLGIFKRGDHMKSFLDLQMMFYH